MLACERAAGRAVRVRWEFRGREVQGLREAGVFPEFLPAEWLPGDAGVVLELYVERAARCRVNGCDVLVAAVSGGQEIWRVSGPAGVVNAFSLEEAARACGCSPGELFCALVASGGVTALGEVCGSPLGSGEVDGLQVA